jgi:hypothetical protein
VALEWHRLLKERIAMYFRSILLLVSKDTFFVNGDMRLLA